MRRVGRHIDRLPGPRDDGFPAEPHPDLSVKDGEHLLEVVAVRRRPAALRNVHVDEGVFAFRVAAGHEDRVGVADKPDVREALILVGPRDGEPA